MLETVLLRDAAISVAGSGAVYDVHVRMRMDVAEQAREQRESLSLVFRLFRSRVGVSGDRHFEPERVLAPVTERPLVDESPSMCDMLDDHHRLIRPLVQDGARQVGDFLRDLLSQAIVRLT
jgi:hypothetical protein